MTLSYGGKSNIKRTRCFKINIICKKAWRRSYEFGKKKGKINLPLQLLKILSQWKLNFQ